MKEAASRLDFERATELRDIIFELKDLSWTMVMLNNIITLC
jgi:excinuclease UvrABC helicase subunit UvrB